MLATFFVAFFLISWKIESGYNRFDRVWADAKSPYKVYRFEDDLVITKDSEEYFLVRAGELTERVMPDSSEGGIKFEKDGYREFARLDDGGWAKATTVEADYWSIWIVHEDRSKEFLKLWVSPKGWR